MSFDVVVGKYSDYRGIMKCWLNNTSPPDPLFQAAKQLKDDQISSLARKLAWGIQGTAIELVTCTKQSTQTLTFAHERIGSQDNNLLARLLQLKLPKLQTAQAKRVSGWSTLTYADMTDIFYVFARAAVEHVTAFRYLDEYEFPISLTNAYLNSKFPREQFSSELHQRISLISSEIRETIDYYRAAWS